MRTSIFKYIFQFVLLVAIQVLFLCKIPFFGFATPYLYILFILTFPIKFPRPLFLIIAFALGFTIDVPLNSLGLHTFSTVLIAFLRPYILDLFVSKNDDEYLCPNVQTIVWRAFIKYTIAIVFIHHTVLFTLEAFSFQHFWLLLLKVLVNGMLTSLLIFATQAYWRKK